MGDSVYHSILRFTGKIRLRGARGGPLTASERQNTLGPQVFCWIKIRRRKAYDAPDKNVEGIFSVLAVVAAVLPCNDLFEDRTLSWINLYRRGLYHF